MDPKVEHPRYSRAFMQQGFDMILEQLELTLAGVNHVGKIKQPEEFYSQISIKLDDEPMPMPELIQTCKKVVENSCKPYHPHFHNQLFGGFDHFSAFGAVMSPLINGSMYTYEIAPVFTLMEREIFDHFRKRLGWDFADGIMTPGGSFGNILGIQLARYHAFPQVKQKGIQHLPPLKIMVANNAHYSLKKGAFLCGLGIQSLVLVQTNQIGQMIPEDLDKKIQEELDKGNKPFMICSLAGSTVEGSIDDIEKISEVAQKYKIWHHLDACFGGTIFFSEKLRKKVGDCKGVDSVVFDPHKGMIVSLQATLFLCQHDNLMNQCNSVAADYLFHKQRASYDGCLDTGNKSLLCGRIIDVLKVWTYFKGNGMKGVQEQIDKEYDLAQYLVSYIKDHPEKYELFIPEAMFLNVCFWCLPQKLIQDKKQITEEEYRIRLSKTTVLAKKHMIHEGKMLTGYSSTKGSPYFWREVMSNPYNTEAEIREEIEWLYGYCQKAYNELYGN